jgi:citronellol/citronellal dehydrogenase
MCVNRFGMTLVALGIAAEGAEHGITGHSLWPATVVESSASINFELMDRKNWRKATCLADACVGICQQPNSYTGQQLIDDEFLRDRLGFADEDFVQYRCDPDFDPPRLLDARSMDREKMAIKTLNRGDIRKVEEDKKTQAVISKL